MNRLPELFSELSEQINSFFTRKNFEEGCEDLHKHCDQLLKEISTMLEILKEYPVYGALAFVGQFKFKNCLEVSRLEVSDSQEVFEAIRAKRAIQISTEAQPSWKCLYESNEQVARTILCLCYLATQNEQTKKRIRR